MNFSFLSPGKYTFKVKAINEDSFESKEEAIVSFLIKPPYWKTWWFITILIFMALLIVLGILYSIHRIRIKEINKRNTLERDLFQQINKFRQQALTRQMNPHFIFNTLNSIQYYIVDHDIRSSTKYLAKFSRLMRIILENSQYDTITIDEELKAIELYIELENVRVEGGFNYNIHIDDEIDTSLYKINSLLFQPFVENSIWHGLNHKTGDKQLNIELNERNNNFTITIEDNGIGRDKANEIKNKRNTKHKSLGTNITDKRIDVMNKLYNQNFKFKYTYFKHKT